MSPAEGFDTPSKLGKGGQREPATYTKEGTPVKPLAPATVGEAAPKSGDEPMCSGKLKTSGLLAKGARFGGSSQWRWFTTNGFHVRWANLKNTRYPSAGFDMRNVMKLERLSNGVGLKFTIGPDWGKAKTCTVMWDGEMTKEQQNRWRVFFTSAAAAVAIGRRTWDA